METTEPRFPFTGLHVYHCAQGAWTKLTTCASDDDPLWAVLERELQRATLGIARATALSRANGGFVAGLEDARAAIHAAGAVADQLTERGISVDEKLRAGLSDTGRMLGALIRTLQHDSDERDEEPITVEGDASCEP